MSSFSVSFTQPCQVIRFGSGNQGLTLVLHGMGFSGERFAKLIEPALTDVAGERLYPDGPFPYEVQRKAKRLIGHAWYLYDGPSENFRHSIGLACDYLDDVLEAACEGKTYPWIDVIGYSQGGYLLWPWVLRKPQVFRRILVVASRLKDEWWGDLLADCGNLDITLLHGNNDQSVKAEAAEQTAAALQKANLKYDLRSVAGGHRLEGALRDELVSWVQRGFSV